MFDFTIVGAGLFGSVCAYELGTRGFKVQVIDKRSHIGGNCYTEKVDGIEVHKYGAHIFHTDDKYIWDYIRDFAEFNNFVNSPIAIYNNVAYNLPFNMNTFSKIWPNVTDPKQAKQRIADEIKASGIETPTNLEEQAIKLVGKTIYEILVKGYTEKQWGKPCKLLPPDIIKRLPVRFTYNNNYFNDKYQGIPIGGYTQIFKKMLRYADVKLDYDFFEHKEDILQNSKKIIYTGQIDKLFDFKFGKLEYRTVSFLTTKLNMDNYQGNAVVNYTSSNVSHTRIIEHKFFDLEHSPEHGTIVSIEFPKAYDDKSEPYYSINNERNQNIYNQYLEELNKQDKIVVGGRLGMYKYFDMDDTIAEALKLSRKMMHYE